MPGDIGAKVAVVPEQLVQPVHSSRGGEAGGVVPEVLAVFPEGHASPKQTSDFIPLKDNRDSLMVTKLSASNGPDEINPPDGINVEPLEIRMNWSGLAEPSADI